MKDKLGGKIMTKFVGLIMEKKKIRLKELMKVQ